MAEKYVGGGFGGVVGPQLGLELFHQLRKSTSVILLEPPLPKGLKGLQQEYLGRAVPRRREWVITLAGSKDWTPSIAIKPYTNRCMPSFDEQYRNRDMPELREGALPP